MSLQGSLRDFSATEILQLLGMQQKSGCLLLERATQRAVVYVTDGKIVSTRPAGMAEDDPFLTFLRKIHRLSAEQYLGIAAIQKESGRDLVDILLTGRYLDSDEIGGYLERQILEDLTRIVRWDAGNYRFESDLKWDQPIHVRLGMEGALIETARRLDEERRCARQFADPNALLGVRDLPDPDEPLAEEEREMFGIIDGRHTLAEVVAAAPLTESEAYEALDRMLRESWIEFVGRRESSSEPVAVVREPPAAAPKVRHSFVREILLAVAVLAGIGGAFAVGNAMREHLDVSVDDLFVVAQMRDVRYALELFRREHGRYPSRIDELVSDRWLTPAQVVIPGHQLYYHLSRTEQAYELRAE